VAAGEEEQLAALGYLAGAAEPPVRYTAADDPKNLVAIDSKMHRMLELYGARELGAAERLAREVLAERPAMPPAWTFLAQVLLEAGRLDDALAAMEDAIGRGLETASLRRQYGLTLAWTGRAEEAVAVLTPLAAGGDPAALNALGTALLEAGRPEQAIAVLERVFARDPDDAQALENLTVAHLTLGRWREAEALARRTLEADPRRAPAWNHLGVARWRQGDGAGALAAWERSLELAPQEFDTLYNLGLKAAELGQPERAKAALARFVREAPAARYRRELVAARDVLARLEGAS
jgi:tetratricopeptide (TPR) repeat protein